MHEIKLLGANKKVFVNEVLVSIYCSHPSFRGQLSMTDNKTRTKLSPVSNEARNRKLYHVGNWNSTRTIVLYNIFLC